MSEQVKRPDAVYSGSTKAVYADYHRQSQRYMDALETRCAELKREADYIQNARREGRPKQASCRNLDEYYNQNDAYMTRIEAENADRAALLGHLEEELRLSVSPDEDVLGIRGLRLKIAEQAETIKAMRKSGRYWRHLSWLHRSHKWRLMAENIKLLGLLRRARGADVPLRTTPVMKDGRLVGQELQAPTAAERRRAQLNADIDAALTKGEK